MHGHQVQQLKFAGMPHKLKFYQKKSAERLKKLRKLIVDNYVMRNADSSPSRRRFLSLYRILYLWYNVPIIVMPNPPQVWPATGGDLSPKFVPRVGAFAQPL